jgi:hypothetical protein
VLARLWRRLSPPEPGGVADNEQLEAIARSLTRDVQALEREVLDLYRQLDEYKSEEIERLQAGRGPR